jgi:hypothetical protein
MRPLFALILGISIVLQSPARADQKFPYKAFVAAEEVYVRSGPGHKHYPTDKLSKGLEVEVYRHTPGGWCAIKPLEGSFSWISSRFAKIEEDNLAVVTEDNISARVGSNLSDDRDGIQVRLHKGEVVEVLETKKIGGGDGPAQTWYKITPPAGEFRWISENDLEPEYAREGLLRRADDGKVLADASDAETPGGKDSRSRDEKLPHEEYRAKLNRLDLELSQMVAEDSSVWSFDALRIGAETLLEEANLAVERGKARLLLNRIARFEDIKDRADKVGELRAETERSNQYIAGLRRTVERAREYVEGGDDRFDGVGRLEQVAPTTPGVPRFALLDGAGNVRSYVTPSTGVNLHKYVGREIGVVGRRGYMPEQKAQHVTANHVTVLEGTTLR